MSRMQHLVIYHECEQFMVKLQSEFNSKPSASVEGHLKVLRSEMNNLLATWSIMAGRNILSDMWRTAQALERELQDPSKSAATALKGRMSRHLGQYSVANARYDSVLCLGYKVQTSGDVYEGMPDDYADLQYKCQAMIEAIQAAYKLVSPSEKADQRMLKIFMAPEFFFRGRNGGYDYNDVLGLAADGKPGLLDMMRKEIGKPIYKDWLFVLGTVVALSRNADYHCAKCRGHTEERLVDGMRKFVCKTDPTHPVGKSTHASVENVAYVCKESEVYTVTKELISPVDYRGIETSKKERARTKFKNFENTVRMGKDVLKVERYIPPNGTWVASNRPSKFQDERMGGCIFTVDGITFGLEVCIDHKYSATATSQGRLDHAANIQIQLIPSAGTTIRHFRTVPNGVVFNVDGRSASHVQVVGRHDNTIKGFELSVRRGDRGFGMGEWSPGTMTGLLDQRAKKHSSDKTAWHKTSSRIAEAPGGTVVCYGPFEIPQTWT